MSTAATAERTIPWLEHVPDNWNVVQARRVFRERKQTGFDDQPLLSVTQESGVVTREKSDIRVWNPGDDVSGYKLVRPGDFVISLRSFQGGLEYSRIEGIVSPAYTPFYSPSLASGQIDFLRHYFKSAPFISSLQPLTTGIRQGKNISFSDFGESPLPLPEPGEARTIADFLDCETAKIDTLIEKKQRLLELLDEKRTALITRAVTRGLDPDMPMKDSGVEWIGEIPEHWEVAKVKHVARMESGHTPDRGTPEYWNDGIGWVSLADSKRLKVQDVVTETEYEISAEGIANSSARLLPKNAVAFSRDATVGLAALLGREMAVSQHFIAWVCSRRIKPRYLLLVLKSMTQELERLTMGATIRTLGLPEVGTLRTALPPSEEQIAIIDYCEREGARVSALTAKIQRAVELLREYRIALMSEAVTGKVDTDKLKAGI